MFPALTWVLVNPGPVAALIIKSLANLAVDAPVSAFDASRAALVAISGVRSVLRIVAANASQVTENAIPNYARVVVFKKSSIL